MRQCAIGTARSACKLVRKYFSLKTRQHYRIISAARLEKNPLIRITKTEIYCFVRIRLNEQYGFWQ